jgi:transposase
MTPGDATEPTASGCRDALAAALRENQLLRQKVELLIKRIFGSSSEQIDRAQLELFLQEPSATPDLPFPPEQTAWRCIGQEVSEQLDYEPARFLRRRLIRRRYVHRSEIDQLPIIAALPERLLERGIAAPGLLANLIVSKYCDHLPLYRQEQIFRSRAKGWLGNCFVAPRIAAQGDV